ncbi:HAD family hydrolase [Candidatus Woesearchaeota archaeon]|jgi:phosphoglycolate phosphatase|nr:HAD family hydrolase [Candidatus Woesearchaeota archaeon]MBT5215538.1 HAD family hydrolase [Candidatus Woesearchaeota archaeon]MBT6401908.1 HAD family hydrolase [Candidatus Woesearchaeota archaeon]
MINAVIFDFDGVIHDTPKLAYSINNKIDPGLTFEEYKDYFNGNLYNHKSITPANMKRFFELQLKLFENLIIEKDIKEELINLSNNFKLFIVSSNNEETLNLYLDNNDITNLFNGVFGMETAKSKVVKLKMILDENNLSCDECVFITDTLGDILEANEIGIRSIGVDFGMHEIERLEKGKPFRIISDFKEIDKIASSI